MAGKRHTPEDSDTKLRQGAVLQGQGKSMAEAIRAIGVTEVTFYRWREKYGRVRVGWLGRLKDLAKENQRLRQAVSDLTLDKVILTEAAKGNY